LDLLRRHDENLPKARAQETTTFVRTNILLAAIKEEEKSGREDWESRIPKMIETLQTNDLSGLTELLKEYIFRPEVCKYWEQLRNQWKWSDFETSNAEVLWERVALLMDMWKCYGEVIRFASCEMLKNWKRWLKWREEKSVPHRWLPGWTSEMTTEEYEEYRRKDVI
jgi:hypothetical protein